MIVSTLIVYEAQCGVCEFLRILDDYNTATATPKTAKQRHHGNAMAPERVHSDSLIDAHCVYKTVAQALKIN